jgi:hypothetical protein
MSKSNLAASTISDKFSSNAANDNQSSKKRPSPFTIRFSQGERAYLERQAKGLSLGSYIRKELLRDYAPQQSRKTQSRQRLRNPKIDEQKLSSLLAGFGQSKMPSNLNQLAKAANCGNLHMDEETEQLLSEACAAVIAMREALFIALGLRSGGK